MIMPAAASLDFARNGVEVRAGLVGESDLRLIAIELKSDRGCA